MFHIQSAILLMADTTCEFDAPPDAPAWGGAALAAGAAVLAGLVLGRKGAAGLAAGVAAAAGVKLLAETRRGAAPATEGFFQSNPDVAPEGSHADGLCGDWVDHDAVLHDHVVPDAVLAAEMLKEKSLPLLDDEGLPVDHVTVHPVYPGDMSEEFPLGPIIWEPGRFVQSSSNGQSETVWFGLQDVMRELAAPAAAEADVVEADSAGGSSTVGLQAGAAPEALAGAAAEPAGEPVPDGTPATPGIKTTSFLLLEDHESEEPSLLPAPAAGSTAVGLGETLLASAATDSPAALGFAPVIAPRPAVKASLPQPRRAGELPRHAAAATAETPGDDKHVLLSKLLPAPGGQRTGAHSRQQRHREPAAPVIAAGRPERWPLVLMLCLMAVISLFLVAGWWNDGELLRRIEGLPVFAGKQAAPEAETLSPKNVSGIKKDDAVKRGPWMSAAPEPAAP